MIRAKNYETVSKFVKVMTKILWTLFFRTRCIRLKCTYSVTPTPVLPFNCSSPLYAIYGPWSSRAVCCLCHVKNKIDWFIDSL